MHELSKLCLDGVISAVGITFVWFHDSLVFLMSDLDTLSQHILLEGGAILVLARLGIAAWDIINRRKPGDEE